MMYFSFLLMVSALMVGQAGAPAVRVLTAGELSGSAAKLDKALVSGVAGRIKVDSKQAFAVTTATGSFWMEPVLYEANNADTGNTSPRCGVFFLKDKEKAVFVPTLGSGWTEVETCTDLEGVGFAEAGSGMPRILLLYAASSPNFSTREPIVLDWNADAHGYQGNKTLSLALTHKGGNASIAGMKRRIKELGDAAK
jgi:hypothetical protein